MYIVTCKHTHTFILWYCSSMCKGCTNLCYNKENLCWNVKLNVINTKTQKTNRLCTDVNYD